MTPPPDPERRYRLFRSTARMLLGLFFRRVEVDGLENIPDKGGGILVSWHPNGMIDPGLIFATFPREVVFGARDGLFGVPVLGWIMRSVGTVPIFRAQDSETLTPEERRAANARSLEALAQAVVGGRFSALFPEGDSHDRPMLQQLKTGAARFYYMSRQLSPGSEPPALIPVGLHYDDKNLFRSNALVTFHPPLLLPPELDLTPTPDEDSDAARERCRMLTDLLEETLERVVYATDSWDTHFMLHRARKLMHAEQAAREGRRPHRHSMEERMLRFAQLRIAWYIALESHLDEALTLMDELREYDADLQALGLEDWHLDRNPRLLEPWLVIIVLIQFIGTFLLFPPILAVGLVINAPAALLLWVVSKVASKRRKDEASLKLMLGAWAFPACWILAGLGAAYGADQLHAMFPRIPEQAPIIAASMVVLLSIFGGALLLRYLRVARRTVRAVRVRLRRRRERWAVTFLRDERARLHDAILELAMKLELP